MKAADSTFPDLPNAIFKQVFDLNPGLVAISEPETGRHLAVNGTWLRVLGYRREDVIGKTVFDFGLWAAPDNREAMVAALADTGEITNFEAHFLKKNRESCFVLISGRSIEVDGRACFLLIGQDVTAERKAKKALQAAHDNLEVTVEERTAQLVERIEEYERTQVALEESEQKFRAFAATSSDWYWETGADHRFTWLSHELSDHRRALGLHNAIGKTRWDFAQDDADKDHWGRHQEVLEAHEPFRDFEYQVFGAETQELWVSVSGMPRFDGNSVFIGYRGTAKNVTDQVRARQELERAHQAALDEKRLSDAVIGNIADGIITVNGKGIIETFNPAAQRIFGYRADEVVGENVSILMPSKARSTHEIYTDNPAQYLDRINSVERDLIGLRSNGETFALSLNLSPMMAGGGAALYRGRSRYWRTARGGGRIEGRKGSGRQG